MSQSDQALDATRFVDLVFSTEVVQVLREAPTEAALQRTVLGLGYRVLGLMQGLAKLDRASHLPLVLAATRGMLELLVDVIMLSDDKGEEKAKQVEA